MPQARQRSKPWWADWGLIGRIAGALALAISFWHAVTAHVQDRSIHHSIEQLDQRYLSKSEFQATCQAVNERVLSLRDRIERVEEQLDRQVTNR